jgi:hypothetical protein
MTSEEFEKLKAGLHLAASNIANAKRPGYTQGNSDVLRNFKRVADAVPCECPNCGHGFNLNAGQVWAVYFLKHVDALVSGSARPNLAQAEPLEGRAADALNYVDLGFAIVEEQAAQRKSQEQLAQKFFPGSELAPRPQSAPGTQLPPTRPVVLNILPWKFPLVGGGLPPLDDTQKHQSEHLTTSEAPEAVQMRLPFGSFVEFPVEDDSVVDYGDRDEIDKARARIEIANTKPKGPVS